MKNTFDTYRKSTSWITFYRSKLFTNNFTIFIFSYELL